MDKIKLDIQGYASIPNVNWEEGWDAVHALSEHIKEGLLTDDSVVNGTFTLPVASKSEVERVESETGLDVVVDESLQQFEDKEVCRVIAANAGGGNLVSKDAFGKITRTYKLFEGNNKIKSFDEFADTGATECGVKSSNYYNAFRNMHSLTSIKFPDTVIAMYGNTLSYTSCSEVSIPSSVKSILTAAFSNTIWNPLSRDGNISKINFEGGIEQVCSLVHDENYNWSGGDWHTELADLYINGELVTNVIVPYSVKSIGLQAFINFGIEGITIPSSVESIGAHCFGGCKNLNSIIVDRVTPPVCGDRILYTGGHMTQYSVPSTCKIYVPDEAVEDYKSADGWSTYADRIVGMS